MNFLSGLKCRLGTWFFVVTPDRPMLVMENVIERSAVSSSCNILSCGVRQHGTGYRGYIPRYLYHCNPHIMQALAAASIEEVNEVWAGLGYYRRARFLLEGAKYIMADRDGLFSTTSSELITIPGPNCLFQLLFSVAQFDKDTPAVEPADIILRAHSLLK